MDPVSFGEPTEQAPPPEQTESSDSLLPGFLKNIPDQDRAIVEKYTKDWDAGVTKRFQSIHDDYKTKLQPYQDLGDPDALRMAYEFASRVAGDPVAAYMAMQQALQANPELWAQIESQGNPQMETFQDEQPDYGEQMSPQVQQMFEQMQNELAELKQGREQDQTSREEERQMAEFDAFIQNLHTEHGDFDDDWVLLQMARGVAPLVAVQNYKEKFAGVQNSQSPKAVAPPIIGGQGGIPSDQVDVSKLRGQDRRNLVEEILAKSQQ